MKQDMIIMEQAPDMVLPPVLVVISDHFIIIYWPIAKVGTGKGSQSYYFEDNIVENTNGSYACDGSDNTCSRNYELSGGQVLDWDVFADKPFFPSMAKVHNAKDAYEYLNFFDFSRTFIYYFHFCPGKVNKHLFAGLVLHVHAYLLTLIPHLEMMTKT